jgi:activator of HSP90 ATPase
MKHSPKNLFRFNRRHLLHGAALVSVPLAIGVRLLAQPQAANDDHGSALNRNRISLHIEWKFRISPAHIYRALVDPKQFANLTGVPAEIDPREGGSFSLFGGQIVGRTVELVPDQRIVQAWRPSHWGPGIFSIVRFVLKPAGSETALLLDHTGFPEGDYDGLLDGWHSHCEPALHKFRA